jgi:hypothetical protein
MGLRLAEMRGGREQLICLAFARPQQKLHLAQILFQQADEQLLLE